MWIESHQSLRNHPKVKKASRLAGINEYEMIGRLHCLWWWALDYAPNGDVTKYSADDIESAVDWHGETGLFYRALIECRFNGHCGFLEVIDEQTVIIHDWYEYAGKLIERRENDARRKRNVRRTSDGHPKDGAQNPYVPNQPNQPNQPTKQNNASAPLPRSVQTYIDCGGGWQPGNLKDGISKKDNCFRVIAETVKDDDASIDLWRRVVSAYCAQWSSKSYTVMLNEYYLQGRVPGESRNGNGTRAQAVQTIEAQPAPRKVYR